MNVKDISAQVKEQTLKNREETLSILITVSDTAEEADTYVQKFSSEFKGETEEIFKKKYELVRKLFGIGECLSAKEADTFKLLYHCVLSSCIMQIWK